MNVLQRIKMPQRGIGWLVAVMVAIVIVALTIWTIVYAVSERRQNEASAEFYDLVRTLESCRTVIDGESTVVLTSDSELYQYLKSTRAPPAARPR